MKPRLIHSLLSAAVFLGSAPSLPAAGLPADWQSVQTFEMPVAGLARISVPIQTLDQARPSLQDLRLYDDSGREVPFLLERPRPAAKITRTAKSFQAVLSANQTTLLLETGMDQPIEAISLESPGSAFIKAVHLHGSNDQKNWELLVQGRPVFRQHWGAGQLRIPLPQAGRWRWVRVTVDDRRSPPIPFSGAQVHAAVAESAPVEQGEVVIKDRYENPGQTRLTIDLGFANADVSRLIVETPDALFMRSVTLAVPMVTEYSVREQPIASGTVYRVRVEDQPVSEQLDIHVENQAAARELVLLVNNQDSPPLTISRVKLERSPVYLVFYSQQPGNFHLLSGNDRAQAPKYDLAALAASLRGSPVRKVNFTPLSRNPGYSTPEVLPGIGLDGSKLDPKAWSFRKSLKAVETGVQQLELDLDVISQAARDFSDLRLLREETQVPYILEHTSISRAISPGFTLTNDTRQPGLSRWIIKLPKPGLPLSQLRVSVSSSLFRRDMTLSEMSSDQRGTEYQRHLGSAVWTRTPESNPGEFLLHLQSNPSTDTLILETQNGDNSPIQIAAVKAFYPATRILFKAKADEALMLYYGNLEAGRPNYDISLVAGQLLSARKSAPSAGAEERLRSSPWSSERSGKGGIIFWSILALVIVVLLVIISRLLPKPAPRPEHPEPRRNLVL